MSILIEKLPLHNGNLNSEMRKNFKSAFLQWGDVLEHGTLQEPGTNAPCLFAAARRQL